jgi:hypothetical protein
MVVQGPALGEVRVVPYVSEFLEVLEEDHETVVAVCVACVCGDVDMEVCVLEAAGEVAGHEDWDVPVVLGVALGIFPRCGNKDEGIEASEELEGFGVDLVGHAEQGKVEGVVGSDIVCVGVGGLGCVWYEKVAVDLVADFEGKPQKGCERHGDGEVVNNWCERIRDVKKRRTLAGQDQGPLSPRLRTFTLEIS